MDLGGVLQEGHTHGTLTGRRFATCAGVDVRGSNSTEMLRSSLELASCAAVVVSIGLIGMRRSLFDNSNIHVAGLMP